MLRVPKTMLLALGPMFLAGLCAGQWPLPPEADTVRGPLVQTEGGQWVNEDTVRTARETAPHSIDLPVWTNSPAFGKDVFTFARVMFRSEPGRPGWLGWS